jgi:tRNA-Thr(GGU) m(6)t(6)A37 methyltransferase TsaA
VVLGSAVPYAFEPIGVVHSPFGERADAPRQASLAPEARGTVELFSGHGYDDALEGLGEWEYAWLLFVFHKNVEEGRGWRPKVLPPRSDAKRGLFATRSPHRPNPIGLSAIKIERVEGLVVHVAHLDVLDGSPVLDLKPYVAYADSYPEARAGWLEAREAGGGREGGAREGGRDPLSAWEVSFGETAREELAWLRDHGVDLQGKIETALALGPQPHAYRRIRPHGAGMRLALKEWRIDFAVEGRRIVVTSVCTGYRPKELATGTVPAVHRAFAARFLSRSGPT